MLAQQLADRRCPGEVVYLDLSTASRQICEGRAKARGLRNIQFVTGSLLDLPQMNIGQFDYIDCTGVLHHLPEPDVGMRAIASVLQPDGGIGVMLYGEYGRSGVYPLQEMLRTLAPPSMALEDRLAMAKRLIRFLPTTNLFRRNPYLNDHVTGGDAGLYDLLLHSCDRAFTVPDIGKMAAAAGLRVVAFLEPVRYEPATYMSDPVISRQMSSLPFSNVQPLPSAWPATCARTCSMPRARASTRWLARRTPRPFRSCATWTPRSWRPACSPVRL